MRLGGVGFGLVGIALISCGASWNNATDDVPVPKARPIDTEVELSTASDERKDAGAPRGEAIDTTPARTDTPAAAVTAQATPSTPTTTTPSSANPSLIGMPQPRPTTPAKKR